MPKEQREPQNQVFITETKVLHSEEQLSDAGKTFPRKDFLNRWIRIGLKANDRNQIFSNPHTHINVDSLREAYRAMDGSKAIGVDGVSKADYGRSLEANLKTLAKRVQRGSYRPKPKREVLIQKANGKTRPIAIACFEDKLVDWVVGKILSAVFAPQFIRNSFGYRQGKSAHQAIKACSYSLSKNQRQNVVEIDFSSFFNTIEHNKLMRSIGKRIADKRFKGLIGRFLKAELIRPNGEQLPGRIGTPQGSIMSPILANIYLNEVVDQWFIQRFASYNNVIVRYASAVFFFKETAEAERFLAELTERVLQYGLSLNPDKTRTCNFTKHNHQHFHFLGFTFYWGKQGSRRVLKIKTQKAKLLKALREFERWVKGIRNQLKLKVIWELAKAKIRGHVNYFRYGMNKLKLHHLYSEATRSLFKWLNRRSQKRSYGWERFNLRLKRIPLRLEWDKLKLKQLGYNAYA